VSREPSALLIDIEWCTGCHACEIAGQVMNNLKADQKCIDVSSGRREVGYRVVLDFIAQPTDLCHLCAPRTAVGKLPACVHHCPPQVIRYGPRRELEAALAAKPHQILFSPSS